MPIRVTPLNGGGEGLYGSPFVGPVDFTYSIQVLLTQFGTDEIDEFGYLKPGIPLTRAGLLLVATNFVHGVTVEAFKVAADNAPATIAALGTIDIPVAVIGMINRDIAEDILGRAYTAAEATGFDIAGSKLVLTNT